MLLSMTGYGDARHVSDALSVAVDLRAVNNRYLKVSLRCNEPYNALEAEIEKVIRRTANRGTIQVQVRVRRQAQAQDFRLDAVAVESYVAQLKALPKNIGIQGEIPLAQILALPGVVAEPARDDEDPSSIWPVVEQVLEEALTKFQAMRQAEGQAMADEFLRLRNQIAGELEKIRARSPQVIEGYRDRLHDRVRSLLTELDIEIDRSELVKEVAVFAERSDIAEEVVRLASHLDQFQKVLQEPESPGRKLEFVTQEMFRETNTIGSKANDVEIARHVVEIKGAIEKIRELVQNVE